MGLNEVKVMVPNSFQQTIWLCQFTIDVLINLLRVNIRVLQIFFFIPSLFVSETCQDYMQKSHFLRITFSLNISGQKWAIDKIPKPKIIYWEVTTLLDSKKNSISCLANRLLQTDFETYDIEKGKKITFI